MLPLTEGKCIIRNNFCLVVHIRSVFLKLFSHNTPSLWCINYLKIHHTRCTGVYECVYNRRRWLRILFVMIDSFENSLNMYGERW